MKNGSVALMILSLVIVLVETGCTSLPRQKNVSPVASAPEPQFIVAPPAPLSNSEQYLIGGEARENSRSLSGGHKYEPDKVYTSKEDSQNLSPQTRFEPDKPLGGKINPQKPQPENRIAANSVPKSTSQLCHEYGQNLIPDPTGQGWTHICLKCGTKIRESAPTTCQSPAPSQTVAQKTPSSSNRLLGSGQITNTDGYDTYSTEVSAQDIPGGVHNMVIRRRKYEQHTDFTRTHGAYPERGN